jgi:zinc protease
MSGCHLLAGISGILVLLTTSIGSIAGPAVVRRALPNGMVVLVRESHAAAVVAVSLMVRADTAAETDTTAGITNFLHRGMVKGTRKHTAVQLVEVAEEIGGRLDASGDADVGEIRGQALARHWESLLSLLAEVALEPTLPPSEIERERRLILDQIQTRDDTPLPVAMDTLARDLYGAHPYARPSVGHRASVGGLTRETLLARYREIYQGHRLVLAVSGDVNPGRVLRRVDRLFGKLPAGVPPGPSSPPDPTPTGERRLMERPGQQAQIVVGYLGPRLSERDYASVKILAAVLGGGIGSRLFIEVREKRGLAYSLGVVNASRVGPAAFVSYLGTAPQNAQDAETALLREIERVRTEPVTEDELARAKAYVLGTLAMDRRTNARQAWYLSFFETVGAGWDFPERYALTVQRVTVADVTAVAQRYLTRPTIVVLRPPLR